jgi:hypothetical protein
LLPEPELLLSLPLLSSPALPQAATETASAEIATDTAARRMSVFT